MKAGQVITEVSDFASGLKGFGMVEIDILKGGNPPGHVCPFKYLNPSISIKEEAFKKLRTFYKSWEEYVGDPSLYDENEQTPGCITQEYISEKAFHQ